VSRYQQTPSNSKLKLQIHQHDFPTHFGPLSTSPQQICSFALFSDNSLPFHKNA
jgi:hypothetical protein